MLGIVGVQVHAWKQLHVCIALQTQSQGSEIESTWRASVSVKCIFTYPLAELLNQKRSPSRMRSNWSLIIAWKSSPGPFEVVSRSPPGQMSTLLMSPLYTSLRLAMAFTCTQGSEGNNKGSGDELTWCLRNLLVMVGVLLFQNLLIF